MNMSTKMNTKDKNLKSSVIKGNISLSIWQCARPYEVTTTTMVAISPLGHLMTTLCSDSITVKSERI
jgi:hypothetical protein